MHGQQQRTRYIRCNQCNLTLRSVEFSKTQRNKVNGGGARCKQCVHDINLRIQSLKCKQCNCVVGKEDALCYSCCAAQVHNHKLEENVSSYDRTNKETINDVKEIQKELEFGVSPTEESIDCDIDDFEIVNTEYEEPEDLTISSRPPFTIYFDTSLPHVIEEVNAIEKILNNAKINGSDIALVDVRNDYELKGLIKSSHEEENIPVLFAGRNKIGGLKEITNMSSSGSLKTKLLCESKGKEDSYTPEEVEQTLGVLGQAIESVETIVSYLNPLSWSWVYRSSNSGAPQQTVEFNVIHTNWYWRELRRKLRFCSDDFLRIHPKHGDIRACHKYVDINRVTIQDECNFIIDYNTNANPDFFRCSPKDQMSIMNILKERSCGSKIVNSPMHNS